MLTTAGPTCDTTSTTAREYASSASPSSGGLVSSERVRAPSDGMSVGMSFAGMSSRSRGSRTSAATGIVVQKVRTPPPRSRVSASRGQLDDETGRAPVLALDADRSVVALEDGLHDRQPESRSVAFLLGGEERDEDQPQVLASDAGSVV